VKRRAQPHIREHESRGSPLTEPLHIVCPHCSSFNRIAAGRPAGQAQCGACKKKLFTGAPIALTGATFD
jgi:thioredoxin 2